MLLRDCIVNLPRLYEWSSVAARATSIKIVISHLRSIQIQFTLLGNENRGKFILIPATAFCYPVLPARTGIQVTISPNHPEN